MWRSQCKCFDRSSCSQAWTQPMYTSSCFSTSPLKVVVFPSPSLQLQMRKFKCLLAVGTRKTQADGRKENQQRAGNNQQKISSPCTLFCAGGAEKCPVPANGQGSPLCSAEGPFSQGFHWIATFWSNVRERHKDARNTHCCSKEKRRSSCLCLPMSQGGKTGK